MKKRYTILFTILFGIIAVVLFTCLIIMPKEEDVLKEIENDIYTISYDNNWTLKEQNKSYIKLEQDSNTLEFIVKELTKEDQELSFEYFINNLIEKITLENETYNLIVEKSRKVTKSQYEGYELLYENGKEQTLVVIARKGSNLLLVNYTASNEAFDVLLDSVENIIYEFTLLDKVVSFEQKLDEIKVTNISFSNTSFDYTKTKEYELWSNHYNVVYQLPQIFNQTNISTTSQSYQYVGNTYDEIIKLTANVQNINLYELVVEKDYITSIPSIIESLKQEEKVSELKVETEEITKKYEGYIYRITYKYQGLEEQKNVEKVYILYALDYLKTFVIEIEATNINVSRELIDDISIVSTKKYGSNIDTTVSNGYRKDNMKKMLQNNNISYYNIQYNILEKYKELDYNQNKYEYRNFGYSYQEESNDYLYHIQLQLTNSGNTKTEIESFKSIYQFYKDYKIVKGKTYTINEKDYTYVVVTYKINDEIVRDSYLLHDLTDGGVYSIKITSKEKIAFQMLKDFTNIEIEKRNLG